MQVKGITIKTTRDFVKSHFGHRFEAWLDTLPDSAKKVYSENINVGEWFDVEEILLIPMDKIVSEFYKNKEEEAGDDMGRYSAEIALKGIYKVFLLAASPQYLMERSVKVINAYYSNAEISVESHSKKQVIFKINRFEGMNLVTEYRMAGWCSKALELCGCDKVSYTFDAHLSKGDNLTQIEFRWV